MTSPVVTAVAPELIAVIKAAQAFMTNLGADPTKLPITAPAALQVFLGSVALQAPAAINAEWSVVQNEANTKLAALIAKLTPAA
jgi:hypothetical protein